LQPTRKFEKEVEKFEAKKRLNPDLTIESLGITRGAGLIPLSRKPVTLKPTLPGQNSPMLSSEEANKERIKLFLDRRGKTPQPPAFPATATTQSAPTRFSWAKIHLFTVAGILGYGFLHFIYKKYWPKEVATNLTAPLLTAQIINALSDKEFQYAYKLAIANPSAIGAIKTDIAMKGKIEQAIAQAQQNLLIQRSEVIASDRLWAEWELEHNSVKLKDLINLSKLLNSSATNSSW
jgi:hypothetical protein